MGLFGRWGKRDDEDEKEVAERAARKAKEEARERKKEKKLEKERAVRELRARMPSLSQVGRNGVFEFAGYLNHTYAVGSIPGGSFLPVYTVIQGHVLYVFPGMERKPSAKPFAFFNIKRAEVEQLGLLQQNPPLPPYRNVFRINLTRNQFGHKSYFFQAPSARELEQWCADLSWRVKASEAQLEARFAPIPRARTLEARRLDDTETAYGKAPDRIRGLDVRYDDLDHLKEVDDFMEEGAIEVQMKMKQRKAARAKKTIGGGTNANFLAR